MHIKSFGPWVDPTEAAAEPCGAESGTKLRSVYKKYYSFRGECLRRGAEKWRWNRIPNFPGRFSPARTVCACLSGNADCVEEIDSSAVMDEGKLKGL